MRTINIVKKLKLEITPVNEVEVNQDYSTTAAVKATIDVCSTDNNGWSDTSYGHFEREFACNDYNRMEQYIFRAPENHQINIKFDWMDFMGQGESMPEYGVTHYCRQEDECFADKNRCKQEYRAL